MALSRLKPVHWFLLVLALAALVLAYFFLANKRAPEAASETAAPSADAQGRVRISAAQRQALGIETTPAEAADSLPVTGLPAEAMPPLAASTQVTVPFAGVVTRVLADEGESVRRGQALLRVQSRELIAIQGDLARARAEAGVAGQQAQRDALLAKEGIIPTARRAESAARAAAASASLGEANAMLAQIRRPPGGAPGEYEILAPQAGVLLRRQASPGQAMEAMAPAFVIAEGNQLDIQFNAPIALRDALRPGLTVELPGGAQGRVVAVGADTDSTSQTLRLRARADAAGAVIAGQQFEVALRLPAPDNAIEVPASALTAHGARTLLYIEENGAFRGVLVDTLGGDADTAVVEGGGLKPGVVVVKKGVSVLKSLAPVAE